MRFKGDFETVYWVFPQDANVLGYLFGGRLMNWVIRSSSIFASDLVKRPVLLGYMGSFDFLNPIRVGDMVSINISPLFSTKHTITVKVAVYSRNPQSDEENLTTAAELTFVSVDENACVVPHDYKNPSPTLEREIKGKINSLRESFKNLYEPESYDLRTVYGISMEDVFFFDMMSGAKLLEYVDQLAAITSIEYSKKPMVTASIDETIFLHPIRSSHIIEIFTRLNAVWKTSAEVEVWVFGKDPISDKRYMATHTFVSMVLVDRKEHLETYAADERIFKEATFRKNLRIERKKRLIQGLSPS
ncbi:MAG: hotdog domain-containing protein [candidate division WOR-3 bacterium]